MDTKIPSAFWAFRQVEAAPPEIKLAGLWMLTNERLTLFGYAEVTPERFAFGTGLPKECLERACEALSEHFVRTTRGYFIPNFIGYQLGRGDPLLANYVCKPLVRALVALHDPDVSALVLQNYPELESAVKVLSSPKPLHSPCQGEEQRRVEKSREEKSRDQGLGVQGEGAAAVNGSSKSRKAKRPGARLPAEQTEPMQSRMLALNAIFRREPTTAWSEADIRALHDSGLLALAELDFIDGCEAVRSFYAAKIPREMESRFWRRTTLGTLLNNWAGELDKARAWTRDRCDGLTKV